MKLFLILALLAVVALAIAKTAAPRQTYRAGQVWSYKTRPGDERSLLKIQKVEQDSALGEIYHVSIGVHLRNPNVLPVIAHTPVSKAVLDASAVSLSQDERTFPSAQDGINEWRENPEGKGVFTITVAEIVQLLDDANGPPHDK